MATRTLVYVVLAVFCFTQLRFYAHASESTDAIKEQSEQLKEQSEQLKEQSEQLKEQSEQLKEQGLQTAEQAKTQAEQIKEQAMQIIEKCGMFEGVKAQIFSNGTCTGCKGQSVITGGTCLCGDGSPCIEWPLPQ